MASAASEVETAGDAPLAISSRGRRTVIEETIDLPPLREPRSRQARGLSSIYGALIRREGPLSRLSIEPYFIPAPSSERKQGYYADYSRWWADRGREDLLSLPGIEATDDGSGLRFVGVSAGDLPDGVDDEHLRPLAEFRSDPRVRATVALNDRYGPGSEEIDEVLRIYDTVAAAGETTSEEINRDYRLDLDSYADVLADLPGVERTVATPPDPEEIKVETYADILSAKQRIDAPPTTVWRFHPEA